MRSREINKRAITAKIAITSSIFTNFCLRLYGSSHENERKISIEETDLA
jgi:hypothetical protein